MQRTHRPTSHKKDPMKQYQGAVSRAQGKHFEEYIDLSLRYYEQRGEAVVEKTPEPMRPTKDLGNGKFIAYSEKAAQPDYKGTLKGGRAVVFEAKYTHSAQMSRAASPESRPPGWTTTLPPGPCALSSPASATETSSASLGRSGAT